MATVGSEPRHRGGGGGGESFGDRRASCAERAISKNRRDKSTRGLTTQSLFSDDRFQLGLARSRDELLPLFVNGTVDRYRINKRLDEVFLVPQVRAGVNGTGDLSMHFFVFAIAVLAAVVLNEHQDVVDVDLDLFDELPFKHDVVVDEFLVRGGVGAELGVEVEVDAAVVVLLPICELLVPSEIVERGQVVLKPQNLAEQLNELFLRRSTDGVGPLC